MVLRLLHVSRVFFDAITTALGYRRTHSGLQLAIGIVLNVMVTVTCTTWILSKWSVVYADIGNNAATPSGVMFSSAPAGLRFSVLDRAWVSNSISFTDVAASPSGWDWDVMQQPFERKWTFLGVSVWYRTRQCLFIIGARYSSILSILLCAFLLNRRTSINPNNAAIVALGSKAA